MHVGRWESCVCCSRRLGPEDAKVIHPDGIVKCWSCWLYDEEMPRYETNGGNVGK